MMVKLKISTAALAAATGSGPPRPVAPAAPPSSAKAKKPKAEKKKGKKKGTTATPPPSALAPAPASTHNPPPPAPTSGVPKIKLRTSSLTSTPTGLPLQPPPPPPSAAAAAAAAAAAPSQSNPTRPTLKLKSSSFNPQAVPPTPPSAPPVGTPILKLKTKQKAPVRKRRYEPGNGYDSEASDREDDPAIEEQFILRMPPGPDHDYVQHLIESRELATSSDVWFKFKDSRRAVLSVRGHLYAGLLVDLPCIIESNKTLDKKNIFKTADICQLLIFSERIQAEEEVWNKVSTKLADVTYPHGLSPPMQHVRKRRFRKRISKRTIEAVEQEVDRLLADDEAAVETSYKLLDIADLQREEEMQARVAQQPQRQASQDERYGLLGEEDYEEDAEGEEEEDYPFPQVQPAEEEEMDEDTLANDLEFALMGGDGDEADGGKDEEEKKEESEESDEDKEAEAVDERARDRERLREEIADIREMVAVKEKELQGIGNAMLKNRVAKVVENLRSELELKEAELAQLA